MGCSRCSTDTQDLTAQRGALVELGVNSQRILTDHGLMGRTRARRGLEQGSTKKCVALASKLEFLHSFGLFVLLVSLCFSCLVQLKFRLWISARWECAA